MPYIGQRPSKGDENNFKILDDISSYTLTFDGSDSSVVSAANDTITSLNHRFVQGQRVTYHNGGGSDIGGLSGTAYFIIKEDHNTIKLATSASNASNGVVVNITGVGGGSSHTLNVAFDGVNTKFKATHTNGVKARITRSAQLVISINGVIQQPHDTATPSTGFGFDLDGTIVFSQAPVATDEYWAHVLTNNNVTFDISDNDIDNFTGNGSTVSFNLSKTPPDNRNVLVTIDGVIQYPNDPDGTVRSYAVVENVLTFVTAPASGVEIQVRHIGFAGSTSGSGSGGVTSFYGRTGAVVLKNTDNIVANNAEFAGNLTVQGTMTTLDTKVTEVDQLEVAANNTTVGVAITQSGSGDLVRLYDGASQVVTIDDEGNVGIGSAIPAEKLDVAGNIKLGSNGVILSGDQLIGGGYPLKISTGSGYIQVGPYNTSFAHIVTDTGKFYFNKRLVIDEGIISSYNEDLIFKTDNDSEERIRIKNDTGNVGIGSAIPQAKLDVTAGATVVSTFLKTTSARSFIEFEHNAGATYNTRFGSATLGAGNVGFIFETGLAASPIDAMVIDRFGAVGINSTTPTTGYKLDVNGDLSLGEKNGVSNTYIDQKQDGDLHLINSGRTVDGASGTPGTAGVGINRYNTLAGDTTYFRDFTVYDGKNSKVLVVDGSAGKVGIGTDNPARILHLHESSSDTCQLHITNSTTGTSGSDGVSFALGSDESLIINQRETNDIVLKTADTERLRITSGGQVGIATDNPNGQFHIHQSSAGSVTAATDANDLVIESSTNVGMSLLTANNSLARIKFGDPDETGAGVIVYNHQNDKFSIVTGTGNRMIIGSDMISARTHYGVARTAGGYTFREVNEGGERAGMHSNASNHLIFKAGGADEKVRINNSGRVGIGTDNPQTEVDILDANNSQDVRIWSKGNQNASRLILRTGNNGNSWVLFGDTADEDIGAIRYVHHSDDNSMRFITNTDERLRITSDGKVKICHVDGANPTEPLHVVATAVNQDIARFTGANKDRGLVISTSVSGSTNDSVINYNADSQSNVGQHVFKTDDNERLRIASDGIITQSATHPQIILKDPSNRQVSLRSPSSSNLAALGTDSSHDLIFYTNGYSNEHLRIKSDGRVRIGEAGGNEGSYRAAIIEETSNTTTASTQLLLYAKHDGTGNTGVGFGGGIRFWGDRNSDNAVQNMGRIMCIADVNSGTNLSGALAFETASSGVNSEKLRITSVGDVQIKVDGNGGASSQQGVLRFYRTSYSGDMKDSRIVFDTSSGTNNDDNNKYCSVIAGKRTASNNGSSDLRFYTCKDENGYTVAERLRIDENGNVQFGGVSNGGPWVHDGGSANGARQLVDFGSGTANRCFGWGGTNANYANIWTEYSSGDLNFATGLRPNGATTGYVSSYGGQSIGRANIELTLTGNIIFRTAPSGTVANGTAVSSLEEVFRIRPDGDAYFGDNIYFGGTQGGANSNDWGRLNVLGANVYGTSIQHNTSVVLTNEQGTTTQAMVLGDTSPGTTNKALWAVSVNDSTSDPTSGSESGWEVKIRVDGDGKLTHSGTHHASGSDDRLKKNKVGITSALSKVCAMEGFTYEWNDVAEKIGMSDGDKHLGLSAQTVEPLAPEVVVVNDILINPDDGTNDYKTIKYERLVPMLVEAIKELKTDNDALKSRISALEGS